VLQGIPEPPELLLGALNLTSISARLAINAATTCGSAIASSIARMAE
jgi:hypothetical protein